MDVISAIDNHFVTRLSDIRLDGESVQVYPPDANRPKGKTDFPSIAVSHYLPPRWDLKAARPHIEVFTPSDEEDSITIPDYLPGAGTYAGPVTWTWGTCPTPWELSYQVDILATVKAHRDSVLLLLPEAIPVPAHVEILGRHVRIYPNGDPVNLDSLEKPLFRSAIRYLVTNVWVDRISTTTKPAMTDPRLEWDG